MGSNLRNWAWIAVMAGVGCSGAPAPTVGVSRAAIASCTCDGTGPGDVPITVACGQTACGSNYRTYSCSAGGWTYVGDTCDLDGGAPPGCACDGTGPDGSPINVACGQTACGSDDNTYSCSAAGWTFSAYGCGGGGTGSGCQCQGMGPGGTSIVVDCGQTACGSDYNTYSCSSSGWSFTASGCGSATPDMASCACDGNGPGGAPIHVACGQTACGSDDNTYSCSSSGWSFASAGCAPPPVDMAGCACDGTGLGGVPIHVGCGQTACGSDDNLYSCSSSGWTFTQAGCTPVADMAGCACDGTGPGGVPIHVGCGQTACGSDANTYSCSSTGWTFTASGCGGPDMAGPSCGCDGTGPGGVPIHANCGQTACGSDENTYSCSSTGWTFTSSGCVVADMATPPSCTCDGTGPGGTPITVACGQTTCGSDYNTYSCSSSGWTFAADGCGSATPDLASCSCDGTGPGGTPITISCGQTTCGSDGNTYSCGASGWTFVGAGCT